MLTLLMVLSVPFVFSFSFGFMDMHGVFCENV